MTYEEFVNYNKRNIGQDIPKYRIEKLLNDKKTCMLKSVNSNVNPSIIDIVHIVAEVRSGRIAVTNPSKIRNWKYFN